MSNTRLMQRCNICGIAGFLDEMTNDEKLGWVDWPCKVRLERVAKEDERFEMIQDKMRGRSEQ